MLPPKIYVKDRKKVYDVECLNFDNKTVGFHDKHGFLYLFNFEEVIFMENTGFKDKNGNNIYEGDIVKCHNKYSEIRKNVMGEYYLGYRGLVEEDLWFTNTISEVVGNIFENDFKF
ncbi:phage hypothetical protein [Gemella bergeri ATCC 700627]|uniref:YopX protein domain-containing protein n=1 Tax=Gemella bergeri ATCC 700627 TaxID=1321820 RepID=U2RW93_9BACL|nr:MULTISPECIES: YopX family protein [Gemella]ERK57838.1 phage hypothetical protein [Gemella bergeri ATCC 700627]